MESTAASPAGHLPTHCDAARALLPLWVDGELDDRNDPSHDRRATLLGHVTDCVRCARLERELRRHRMALLAFGARDAARDVASAALRERVAALFAR